MTKKKKLTEILKFIFKLSILFIIVSAIILTFTKEDTSINDLSTYIITFSSIFATIIFFYFVVTGVIKLSFRLLLNLSKHLFSRLKSEPFIIVNLVLIIIVLIVLSGYQNRLTLLEEKFGGREKVKCSEEGIKNDLSQKVVRIIGSYGEGSGFPVSEDSIITNFHVIEGEPSPKIVFPNGSIETPTKILASKDKDIAILSLDKKLEPLLFHGWFGTIPNYSDITIGEPLYAFGYPLGSDIKGDPAMIKGAFSGKRWLEIVNMNVIESDIGLISGMSGGPIVDSCGLVVGINTIGIGGLSMFLDIEDVQKAYYDINDEYVTRIVIDTSTPKGAVEAYYTYIKARNLEKAFELISSDRKSTITSFEKWVKGYANTLHVNLILTEADEDDEKVVKVKFETQDWIDGEMVYKYFEGTWEVIEEGSQLRLNDSNVKQVDDPEYWWFYSWEIPDWWE